MRKVYRIAAKKHARDVSGGGAAKYGGRWNSKGEYVLYTANTASLAMLEWLAHARDRDMEIDYYLITLELPDAPILKPKMDKLPANWMATPPLAAVQAFGDTLLKDGKCLGIEVPSVVMPVETNIVLNVYHPSFTEVKILSVTLLQPDARLLS
jgi:RES domain-containing protein